VEAQIVMFSRRVMREEESSESLNGLCIIINETRFFLPSLQLLLFVVVVVKFSLFEIVSIFETPFLDIGFHSNK
jgi:hypothetical protein